MELLGRKILNDFKEKHPDAKSDLESWEEEIKDADWDNPHQLKERYPKATLLGKQRVVFNICWNRFRLLVAVAYKAKTMLVQKIGTHKEYDKWKLN
jgi:mRNA interferase HigB